MMMSFMMNTTSGINSIRHVSIVLNRTIDTCYSSILDSVADSEANTEVVQDMSLERPTCKTRPARASLSTMKRILYLKDDENYSEKGIQSQYPWFRRAYLAEFRRAVQEGGSVSSKRREIDAIVRSKVIQVRGQGHAISGKQLKIWGIQAAKSLGARWFKASNNWLFNFCRRNRISSRAFTRTRSRTRQKQGCTEQQLIERFYRNYEQHCPAQPSRLIWNTDQAGFNPEPAARRTLSHTGERDTELIVSSVANTKTSHTIQPIISRDGRAIGKLLIVLKEPKGDFGPNVAKEVAKLEKRFGNVRVLAGKSHIITTNLYSKWIRDVLTPAIVEETAQRDETATSELDATNETLVVPGTSRMSIEDARERANQNSTVGSRVLLLGNSWSVHNNQQIQREFLGAGARLLMIPPGTTGKIQPLDKGFFRQYRQLQEEIIRLAGLSRRALESLTYIVSFGTNSAHLFIRI